MSELTVAPPLTTVFMDIWNEPDGHIFKSADHGVMAIASRFPKMPLEVVIALSTGTPGVEQHFFDLELEQQRKINEVSLAIGPKILSYCGLGQHSMLTIEGFAVRDHAHVVQYAGERGQAINRYSGPILGDDSVQRTKDLITLSAFDVSLLEARLDRIDHR